MPGIRAAASCRAPRHSWRTSSVHPDSSRRCRARRLSSSRAPLFTSCTWRRGGGGGRRRRLLAGLTSASDPLPVISNGARFVQGCEIAHGQQGDGDPPWSSTAEPCTVLSGLSSSDHTHLGVHGLLNRQPALARHKVRPKWLSCSAAQACSPPKDVQGSWGDRAAVWAAWRAWLATPPQGT